jgi:hypothetical protein
MPLLTALKVKSGLPILCANCQPRIGISFATAESIRSRVREMKHCFTKPPVLDEELPPIWSRVKPPSTPSLWARIKDTLRNAFA